MAFKAMTDVVPKFSQAMRILSVMQGIGTVDVTIRKRSSFLDEGIGTERQPTTTSDGDDQRGVLIT
jgi:hypothetical protein